MLEININLVPHGKLIDKSILGTITIVNDGTGDRDSGNYTCLFNDSEKIIECRIEGFNRRSEGVFALLKEALNTTNFRVVEESLGSKELQDNMRTFLEMGNIGLFEETEDDGE